MSQKSKIIIAIIGGAMVGSVGVCGIVWPQYGGLCVAANALICLAAATITGINIQK